MMKLIFCFIFFIHIIGAQFIFTDGTDVAELRETGFTQTINPDIPPQRRRAMSWTVNKQESSTFYIFGGFRFKEGQLSDFWKYEYKGKSNQNGTWTFLGNKPSFYGQRGVPSPDNWPPPRESGITFTDSSGNLYLLGGFLNFNRTNNYFNDLWRFDGSVWTWIHGEDKFNVLGKYGDQGVPGPDNMPGSRSLGVASPTSKDGVYLFGGNGFAMNPIDDATVLGDFWSYNITTNEWTHLQGLQFSIPRESVYGTKGVPASTNMPGTRKRSCSFVDSQDNFYLFGGKELQNNFRGLNDLWRFDGKNWTWIGGDSQPDQLTNYGTFGLPAETNRPGARENVLCWCDKNDGFWFFSGTGRGVEVGKSGLLNDLWLFNKKTNMFIWAGGSNEVHNYGSYPARFGSGMPSSREQASSFLDFENNMWIYGGYGYDKNGADGNLGDLWKLVNPGIPKEPFQLTDELIILFLALGTLFFCFLSAIVFLVFYLCFSRYEGIQGSIQTHEGEGEKNFYDNIEDI